MKHARPTKLPERFRKRMWALYQPQAKHGDQALLTTDLRRFLKNNQRCLDGWLMLGDLLGFVRKAEAEELECFCRALVLDASNYDANIELAMLLTEKLPLPVLRYHVELALAGCPDTFEESWVFDGVERLSKQRQGLKDLAVQARRRNQAIMKKERARGTGR